MNDPKAWISALGPVGLMLAFVLAVIALAVIALTGIPRWGIPGLAWELRGLRGELHGLRSDLRVFMRGEHLPDLASNGETVPPPPGDFRESIAPHSARVSSPGSRRSDRRR